jgi:hypothetical protein
MRRTFLVVAILPALAGCAVASQWVRTDGGSVDQAQRQATLAQCKFRDNAIDARVLPSLTAEDLKDLGVTLVGHRRRLLDAIAGGPQR